MSRCNLIVDCGTTNLRAGEAVQVPSALSGWMGLEGALEIAF